MLFNSWPFLIFFTAFFVLYWFGFAKNLKLQNLLLLVGSYFFYAWADWRFLFFLIAVSALNFFLGIYIERSAAEKNRKWLLYLGLLQGIGGLAFFKYYNFFAASVTQALASANITAGFETLHIIIPVGISFFTFRTMSYLLDIGKGKMEATKDWIVFFNYISFFPSLLSGPIDKAKMFVPQLENARTFDYNTASEGMRQILWGLFKKVAVANNCAPITAEIFGNYQNLPASSLFLGAFLYTIQIYADFSGYSDMAIGIAKLLGFSITKNFDFPFFAQNIAEFWRKWHISLTSWLTEYVFTPLSISFRDYGNFGLIAAIIINFTIIGIWHGANWTYVLFGFLHGCYYIPLILNGTMNKKKKIAKGNWFPNFGEFLNISKTFLLVMLTFILFRSPNIEDAWQYLQGMFSISLFSMSPQLRIPVLALITIMMAVEWFARNQEHVFSDLEINWKRPARFAFYCFVLTAVFLFSNEEQQFIYFQF